MNKKEIYLSFVLFALAFVILLVTLYPFHPQFSEIGKKPIIPIYSCPVSEWVDCLPGLGDQKPQCQPNYLNWAKINCPNFKGAAY